MLLAMMMSIMAGVWTFLMPYVNDFQDSAKWSSTEIAADRIEDRLEVSGVAPKGSSTIITLPLVSTAVNELRSIETWTIAADVYGLDQVDVEVDGARLVISDLNDTATKVRVSDGETSETLDLDSGEVEHNLLITDTLIIEVLDSEENVIHKHVELLISGLEIATAIQGGEFQITLINNARASKLTQGAWSVERMPAVSIDTLVDGTLRVSILLTDVQMQGNSPSGRSATLEFMSKGSEELFSGDARNLRFNMISNLHSIITPIYHENWLMEHQLNMVSGTLDEFTGFGPFERASGSDGITLLPDVKFDLEVDLRKIEVIP